MTVPGAKRTRRRGLLAVLICASLGLAGLVPTGLVPSGQSAHADVPAACGTPDIACAWMYIADDRSGDYSIDALPGATFGLFLDDPTATIDANNGFAVPDAAHPVYFTCTSDAAGDCVFQIPIQAGDPVVGAMQTAPYTDLGTGHVPQGTSLMAAALAAPSGYYANPWWNTGPLSGQADQMAPLRHVFTTPPLVGGQTYEHGVNWIGDPGRPTVPPTSVPGNDYSRRVASAGRTPLSRVNLDMPTQCGINVALVVDVSSSVGTATPGQPLGARPALVQAMDTFVDALHGTPSQLALFTFGTDSPATGFGPNTALRPVGTAAEAQAFKSLYNDNAPGAPGNRDWDDPAFAWPTNYTNWDRGFAAAAEANGPAGDSSHYDLLVFITDGNPTVYGPAPLTSSGALKDRNSGYTRFREVGDGLASANLVKSQDTRVLALGVGAGVSGEGSEVNLRTVSGRDAYDGGNIMEADYLQATDYAAAGEALHDVILDNCAPSISIVKRILPAGATSVDDARLPSSPWSLTVDAAATSGEDVAITPTGEATTQNTSTAATDLATGSKAFDLGFSPGDVPVALEFSEAGQAGYTPRPEFTTCENKSTEESVAVTASTGGAPGDSMSVSLDQGIGVDDAISCVIYNEEPPSVVPASVVVHKQWELHTATGVALIPDGLQPPQLDASLLLTGPLSLDFIGQDWDVPRSGYNASPAAPAFLRTVRIREELDLAAVPGCALGGQYIDPGPAGSAHGATELATPAAVLDLVPGLNEWTLTNVVTCVSTLTLVKDAQGGPLDDPADEQLWTLGATADPAVGVPRLEGFSGASGTAEVTSVEVMPGAIYTLSETRPADPPIDSPGHYTYHYTQLDNRTTPLLYPGSTGSWACHPADDPDGDPSIGNEGAIVVPLGMDYECTAINRTATMTVSKTVLPSGDPSAFTFRAQWLPPLLIPASQATPHDFRSGEELSLVPNQHYELEELDTPGFALASLTCTSAGDPFDPADFALLPGAVADCQAVNQAGDWTAVKESTPASGTEVAPGDEIEYRVTAYQLVSGGSSSDVVVTDDLSGVLGHASVVDGSIEATAGSATLGGDRIVWTIPTLTDAESPVLSFRVRVAASAFGVTLDNLITSEGGQDCALVDDPAYLVGPFAADCAETHHPTPPRAAMPVTGVGVPLWLLIGIPAVIVLGVLLLALGLRRRRP